MNEVNILAILNHRFKTALNKASKYAINSFAAVTPGEKCRNEVEMAYHAGKAEAYMEVITLLKNETSVGVELRELIESTANEVLQLHSLERLKGEIQGVEVRDGFEDGVRALKQRLLRLLEPGSFDIQVVGDSNVEEHQNMSDW